MSSEEEPKGAQASANGSSSSGAESVVEEQNGAPAQAAAEDGTPYNASGEYYDDGYGYENYDDPYASTAATTAVEEQKTAEAPAAPPPAPPPSDETGGQEDDEEEGMLRMSFLEHLEELRSRIIKALCGLGIAFIGSIVFAPAIWKTISEPAVQALTRIGADPNLAQLTPMDAFSTIYIKVPMLTAVFLASPWVLYQVWAFIAPGLYKRERRWAAPFIICSAGLFIAGGLFAYFVAFRFGLEFLLSIGKDINVKPVVSLTEYFHLFVNVTLGIGLVFELPILVFFLTLLRITTPGFLIRNSRYAILVIVVLAAIVTPTPDIFNLMIFSVPMCVLYFLGVFASYILVLHRDDQPFPWKALWIIIGVILLIAAAVLYFAVEKYHYRPVPYWPFLAR